MDFIFKIGIILLPFDNLFFAPSNGWATITPIVLFVYVLFNIKYVFEIIKKYKNLLIIAIIMLIFSTISFFVYGLHISATLDTIFTLFLGICSLFAFEIYFIYKKNDIKSITNLLIKVYMISLIIGWIQFLAIKFEITPIYKLFDIFTMRNYMSVGRVQFSFTEPSFIGMHIFGVLLPLYFITKEKKILKLILCFVISNFIFDSSVRFILDSVIVLLVLLFSYLIRHKKALILLTTIIVLVVTLNATYTLNNRLKNIIDQGVYADNSLAARYFRITSSIYGYFNEPYGFFFGYGMGNSILPMKIGYSQAYSIYKGSYFDEIEQIANPNNFSSNASFCLYTRIISEYGIIVFVLLAIYISISMIRSNFKYKYELLIILLYLYIQFDSYAFYTLWIFMAVLSNYKKTNINLEKGV